MSTGERPDTVLVRFVGGPLDTRRRWKEVLAPLPESMTIWKHRDAPGIVEIGAGGHSRDWHGDRQRSLWEPHRYERDGEFTMSYVGQKEPPRA